MDDLAPAPAQRTSDDGGRTLDENFAARRKPAKKVPSAPAQKQDPEPDIELEPETDHQIDVLG